MPRTARCLVGNEVYHVLNRGNGRQTVFAADPDYAEFLRLLRHAKDEYPVALFGYCVMPNHFHLVVRPESGDALSRFMQWLLTTHVRRHHRRRKTSGHVWQGRYKSFLIQEDAHLLMVMRYVERNPVRAELAESAKDWLWSSHCETLGIRGGGLLDDLPIELPDAWESYVDEPLDAPDLGRIRQSVERQLPY